MLKVRVLRVLVLVTLVLSTVGARPIDELDKLIHDLMARRQIVGLSLAIVHEGRIVDVRAYGTTTRNGKNPVTTSWITSEATAGFSYMSKPMDWSRISTSWKTKLSSNFTELQYANAFKGRDLLTS